MHPTDLKVKDPSELGSIEDSKISGGKDNDIPDASGIELFFIISLILVPD